MKIKNTYFDPENKHKFDTSEYKLHEYTLRPLQNNLISYSKTDV